MELSLLRSIQGLPWKGRCLAVADQSRPGGFDRRCARHRPRLGHDPIRRQSPRPIICPCRARATSALMLALIAYTWPGIGPFSHKRPQRERRDTAPAWRRRKAQGGPAGAHSNATPAHVTLRHKRRDARPHVRAVGRQPRATASGLVRTLRRRFSRPSPVVWCRPGRLSLLPPASRSCNGRGWVARTAQRPPEVVNPPGRLCHGNRGNLSHPPEGFASAVGGLKPCFNRCRCWECAVRKWVW